MELLGIGNNAKTIKSDKGGEYLTAIMYLEPRSTRICPYQDIAKCKEGCLNTSGRASWIKKGNKTNKMQTSLPNGGCVQMTKFANNLDVF